MSCTSVVKARVPPEIRSRLKAISDRELLTEAAWLRRLVVREIRATERADSFAYDSTPLDGVRRLQGEARQPKGGSRRVYVRLCPEDRLLLDARAAARGIRPATYLAVLTRSHLRSLAPLPKEELLALRRSIAELAAIGRNINQIARAANGGGQLPNTVGAEFRAMLTICEALRNNTKELLKANVVSWASG